MPPALMIPALAPVWAGARVCSVVGCLSLALVFLCGSAVLSTASAQDSDSSVAEERAQARVFEALDLMDAGSYAEARLLIKVALELHPALDRAWYYLAQCSVELGRKSEASEALDVYEGRDLTEYERTQVAELRRRVSQLAEEPGASAADEAAADPAAGSVEGDAGDEARGAEPVEVPQSSSAQARPPMPPGPGPVLLIAGGVAAGLGVGFVAGGLSMSGDIDTWAAGQGLYYAGLGLAVGGGASAVVGIPLSVIGARKSVKVAVSCAVQPELGATSIWVSGRW
ncbi:MAG: hypothetical protein CL928_12965 [Deltaproteobacteria bacterium]|nr:hypothetical protein [Deltaproteobacteria bacterium]